MANCDHIPVNRLVAGWLDSLEVEAITQRREAAAALRVESSLFTENQKRYADWKLSFIRQLRSRIPAAWKRASVLEE